MPFKKIKSKIHKPNFKEDILTVRPTKHGMIIFSFIFATAGVVSLLLSQAATSTPSVRYVILCAKDKCDTSVICAKSCGSGRSAKDVVDSRASAMRSWYKTRLSDKRAPKVLRTTQVTGNYTVSEYRNSGDLLAKLYSEKKPGTTTPLLHKDGVKTVVIFALGSSEVFSHCGVAYYGGDLGLVDPAHGCVGNQSAVYAHELSHQFYNKTADGVYFGDRTDVPTNNLMRDPFACSGQTLSNCRLIQAQVSTLQKSSWFPVLGTGATSASNDPEELPLGYPTNYDELEGSGTTTPPPTGGVSPINLYKFYNEGIIDNLYSTNRDDAAKSVYGYSYQGCVAGVMPSQVAGTVPLHRYFNSGSNGAFGGDTFYTITTKNDGYVNDDYASTGYGYVGIAGYVFTTQQPGTVPFKRHFAGAPKTDHFYTTEAWNNGFLDYYFENNEGYVYPPQADYCGPTDPVPPSPQKRPLYLYYNSGIIDNFYTLDYNPSYYQSVGWAYQGCKAVVWDRQVPGSTPLYRYWNSVQGGYGGDHLYTIDRDDAGLAGYGYAFEGSEGYVFRSAGVGGTEPFNRYFAGYPKTDHYYTMDAWTNGFLDYYFERTEAYTYRCQ